MPLLIAGEIFNYPAHRAYLEDDVRPLLDSTRASSARSGSSESVGS